MVLPSGTADGLHGRFIGDEFESGTRNFTGDAIQKFEGEADAFAGMMGDEAAGEEFSCGASVREQGALIVASMLEQIDSGERSAMRGGDASVSMPRRAVHPDLFVAGAQNDAVVAEDADAGAVEPKTRGGTFSGTGVTEEKMTTAGFIRNSHGMNLDAFATRKPVNHEEFVERIFERIDGAVGIEIAAREENASGAKFAINPSFLVGRHAQKRREEAEAVSAFFSEE
jgi:hypothetical protein